jgi:hypothetical protein
MRTKNCTALVTVAVVSLFLAFLSSTMAYAQAPAGPNRPAAVPEGYVITPFGYFDPSCVQHIKEGETLLGDARIRHADGTEDANVHFCNYPSYTAKGEVITEGSTKEKPPTISWSWIVSSEATTSTSYGEIVATWLVPPSPTSHDGQTVYLFPGLMDNADQVSIIQPVLGWGGDYATSWGIASWNCCPSTVTA